MNITISYQPNAKELARASSLFIEKKTLLRITIGLMNLLLGIFFLTFILSLVLVGFQLSYAVAALACGLWLFGRRPFNEWLLRLRMQKSQVIEKPITIDVSANGIVWSGKGLMPGKMAWGDIKYLLEAQNGFIIPNTFTRFLWLPLRGFENEQAIAQFKALIVEKGMVLKVFRKWRC